ncbi:hypothetical protein P9239_00195 [Caballeronia sp. LZ062]|nr:MULTISPECIES: hypothetical protein [unclassified Caballeronia]MDR5856638.1 hypothetical protein [Caballeronia sp. LZ050]MDR5868776.1 hypothetical protein [Caballeronia sp. LZ062]
MSSYHVVLLIWLAVVIAVVAFNRGADERVDRRIAELAERKKRIQWPAAH